MYKKTSQNAWPDTTLSPPEESIVFCFSKHLFLQVEFTILQIKCQHLFFGVPPMV